MSSAVVVVHLRCSASNVALPTEEKDLPERNASIQKTLEEKKLEDSLRGIRFGKALASEA